MLWDYLCRVINKWDGDTLVMGDFSEVRVCSERVGSEFHAAGVLAFSNFIATAGLFDIPLGGYSSTWSDRIVGKMSKLNRFLVLVSKGLLENWSLFLILQVLF